MQKTDDELREKVRLSYDHKALWAEQENARNTWMTFVLEVKYLVLCFSVQGDGPVMNPDEIT